MLQLVRFLTCLPLDKLKHVPLCMPSPGQAEAFLRGRFDVGGVEVDAMEVGQWLKRRRLR